MDSNSHTKYGKYFSTVTRNIPNNSCSSNGSRGSSGCNARLFPSAINDMCSTHQEIPSCRLDSLEKQNTVETNQLTGNIVLFALFLFLIISGVGPASVAGMTKKIGKIFNDIYSKGVRKFPFAGRSLKGRCSNNVTKRCNINNHDARSSCNHPHDHSRRHSQACAASCACQRRTKLDHGGEPYFPLRNPYVLQAKTRICFFLCGLKDKQRKAKLWLKDRASLVWLPVGRYFNCFWWLGRRPHDAEKVRQSFEAAGESSQRKTCVKAKILDLLGWLSVEDIRAAHSGYGEGNQNCHGGNSQATRSQQAKRFTQPKKCANKVGGSGNVAVCSGISKSSNSSHKNDRAVSTSRKKRSGDRVGLETETESSVVSGGALFRTENVLPQVAVSGSQDVSRPDMCDSPPIKTVLFLESAQTVTNKNESTELPTLASAETELQDSDIPPTADTPCKIVAKVHLNDDPSNSLANDDSQLAKSKKCVEDYFSSSNSGKQLKSQNARPTGPSKEVKVGRVKPTWCKSASLTSNNSSSLTLISCKKLASAECLSNIKNLSNSSSETLPVSINNTSCELLMPKSRNHDGSAADTRMSLKIVKPTSAEGVVESFAGVSSFSSRSTTCSVECPGTIDSSFQDSLDSCRNSRYDVLEEDTIVTGTAAANMTGKLSPPSRDNFGCDQTANDPTWKACSAASPSSDGQLDPVWDTSSVNFCGSLGASADYNPQDAGELFAWMLQDASPRPPSLAFDFADLPSPQSALEELRTVTPIYDGHFDGHESRITSSELLRYDPPTSHIPPLFGEDDATLQGPTFLLNFAVENSADLPKDNPSLEGLGLYGEDKCWRSHNSDGQLMFPLTRSTSLSAGRNIGGAFHEPLPDDKGCGKDAGNGSNWFAPLQWDSSLHLQTRKQQSHQQGVGNPGSCFSFNENVQGSNPLIQPRKHFYDNFGSGFHAWHSNPCTPRQVQTTTSGEALGFDPPPGLIKLPQPQSTKSFAHWQQ